MSRQTSPRLLIVATDALGWRSQSAVLREHIAAAHPEIAVRTLSYLPSRLARPLLKDVYARFRRRRLGLLSSMAWARLFFRRPLTRAIAEFRPDAVLFVGHFAAGALPDGPRNYRTGMVCDVSVPVARRLFRPTQLSDADEREERRIAAAMDIVVANSAGVAESFRSDHGLAPDRVVVARPFCRLPAAADRELRRSRPRVGFVGHDLTRKGGDLLLAAFDAGLGREADLVMAGAATGDVSPRPWLTLLGPVPNHRLMAEVMPGFDILCLPTREDLSPLVLAEAGSLGIPCVATDVGFIRELVLHERTGLLVPLDDVAALAAAIRRLVGDHAARAAMGSAAAAHVRQSFGLADSVASLVDRLLPDRGIGRADATRPLRAAG